MYWWFFRLFSKVYYTLGLLGLITLIGTLGFYYLEEFSLLESVYMTTITVSTVGFKEVRELSDEGRLFTVFLIVSSFGIFAYAVTSLTSYLLDGEYRKLLRLFKISKMIEKLNDHIVVCGYGRVGKEVISELSFHRQPFVVVEQDPKAVEELREQGDIPYIQGDATVDQNLLNAGLDRAKALITSLPNDADNVYVVLSAKEMVPSIKIICRASNSRSVKKLRTAGATNVIMPDSVGGAHMASLVMTPDLIEFLDHISIKGKVEANLESIQLQAIQEDMAFHTIRDLETRNRTGCNILGVKTEEGEFIVNPSPETIISNGSQLFVLGEPDQVRKLRQLFETS